MEMGRSSIMTTCKIKPITQRIMSSDWLTKKVMNQHIKMEEFPRCQMKIGLFQSQLVLDKRSNDISKNWYD